jgi:hypothetical protein
MSDDILTDYRPVMVGLLFGAIICVALILVGLWKFFVAEEKSSGFNAMLYMAAGVLALVVTPSVTMLFSKLVWERL